MDVVLTFLICAMVFCIYIYFRVGQVLKLFIQMLDAVSSAANIDIRNGKDWQWRYDYLNRVSFDKILYTLWRPLKPESFYSNLDFMEAPNER